MLHFAAQLGLTIAQLFLPEPHREQMRKGAAVVSSPWFFLPLLPAGSSATQTLTLPGQRGSDVVSHRRPLYRKRLQGLLHINCMALSPCYTQHKALPIPPLTTSTPSRCCIPLRLDDHCL